MTEPTSSNVNVFEAHLAHDNPIVRDHRVHGARVLPGVTFIDLILRMAAAQDAAASAWTIRDLLFMKPVVAHEGGARRLGVEFVRRDKGQDTGHDSGWSVNVDTVAAGGTPQRNASAVVEPGVARDAGHLDIAGRIAAAHEVRDMGDLYARLRALGIEHFDFMRVRGTIYKGDGYVLATLELGALASEEAGFFLHPALLDAATGILLELVPEQATTTAFIPMHVGEALVYGSLQGQCHVHIRCGADAATFNGDTLVADIDIHDAQGRQVVRLGRITAKSVRHTALIESVAPADGPSPVHAPRVAAPPRDDDAGATDDVTSVIVADLKRIVAGQKNLDVTEIRAGAGFYDLGLESVDLLHMVKLLEKKIGGELYPTLLFEYSSINELARFLAREHGRHWQAGPGHAPAAQAVPAEAHAPSGPSYFGYQWRLVPREAGQAALDADCLLVFAPARFGRTEHAALAARCGKPVIVAYRGERFEQVADFAYTIAAGDVADYGKLVELLGASESRVAVLYAWSAEADAGAALEQGLDAVAIPLLHLTQALVRNKTRHTAHVVVAYDVTQEHDAIFAAAASGFFRSVRTEHPRITGATVGIEGQDLAGIQVLSECAGAAGGPHDRVLWTQDGRRYESVACPVHPAAAQGTPWRERGVYLITGGLGGLGLIFGQFLARTCRARLVLTGRSPLGDAAEAQLQRLREAGADAVYVQADVACPDDVRRAVAVAHATFGELHGVLHSAGVLADAWVTQLKPGHFQRAAAPKYCGAVNLDEATAALPLECFILFSSAAAAVGNVGQASYGYANALLDEFALMRQRRCDGGARRGKTLSVQWPLWRDGGMRMDEAGLARMLADGGIRLLENDEGVAALTALLAAPLAQALVFPGRVAWLTNRLAVQEDAGVDTPAPRPAPSIPAPSVPAPSPSPDRGGDLIAIVGMSARFPDAADLDQFWDNLKSGRDSIREIPAARWDYRRYFDPNKGVAGKHYCKWGGFIDEVDQFDPMFFGIAPVDAIAMDPQERLLLMHAWAALEDAGLARLSTNDGEGSEVGVFIGAMWEEYDQFEFDAAPDAQPVVANSWHHPLANRISYSFNFSGPSLVVDTACSSSLLAIHMACDSLRKGESRVALAGGVNLSLHHSKYVRLSRFRMLSSTGNCKPFGQGADGYVPGEGVGVVVLRPLADALREGDRVLGVIRASAVNHCGRTGGFTVPSARAQAKLVSTALRQAGLRPQDIGYVEAHGTGTELGDPIEVDGLARVFKDLPAGRRCALGSVKSNIGHLEGAAGMAGVAKVVLQMRHRTLVPSLHADTPNPHIDFAKLPFQVQTEAGPWEADGGVRRAGISSFGAGGTNVHLIVEDHPAPAMRAGGADDTGRPALVLLSARTPAALRARVEQLQRFVAAAHGAGMASGALLQRIAYTLQVGRKDMEYRLAIEAADLRDLGAALNAFLDGRAWPGMRAPAGRVETACTADAREVEQALRERDWHRLGHWWLAGEEIAWHAAHAQPLPKIALPTYPFQTKRYWAVRDQAPEPARVDVPAAAVVPAAVPAATPEVAPLTIGRFVWRPVALPAPASTTADAGDDGAILIVTRDDDLGLSAGLLAAHRDRQPVVLALGNLTKRTAVDRYLIDAGREEEGYAEALTEIGPVARVYFLAGLQPPGGAAPLAHAERATALALDFLYLAKALAAHQGRHQPLDITVFTSDVYRVTARDTVAPHAATLPGMALTLATECASYRVRLVDIAAREASTLTPATLHRLALLPAQGGRCLVHAWRDGALQRRHIGLLAPQDNPVALPWRKGGVYLIVGGTGGVGLELSRYLAEHWQAGLAWVGRRAGDAAIAGLAGTMAALGGRAAYFQADVTDLAALTRAVDDARRQFGRIDGIVHCALVLKDAAIPNMSTDAFLAALAPKVAGACNLVRATDADKLDVALFMSSMNVVAGVPGQANYVAGSTFLDAFGAALDTSAAYPVHVVDWGFWGDVGAVASEQQTERFARIGIHSIGKEAGIAALFDAMRSGQRHSIISRTSHDMWATLGWVDDAAVPDDDLFAALAAATGMLDEYARARLFGTLHDAGAFAGGAADADDVRRALRLQATHAALFDACLDMLERGGCIELDAGRKWRPRHPPAPPADLARQREEILRRGPALKGHVDLLDVCVDALPDILRGARDPMETLFPRGSFAQVQAMYQGNPTLDYLNAAMARLVCEAVAQQCREAPGKTVRILEVGAGTGATSEVVLEQLRAAGLPVSYVYTDISAGFTNYGRNRFAATYPFVEFQVLDVQKDIAGQGFARGGFDIVLATNVIHATSHLARSLAGVNGLLRHDGMLLLNEAGVALDSLTLIFGLTKGWWLFEDRENRLPHSPLAGQAQWHRVLAETGFRAAGRVACDRHPALADIQGIYIAYNANRDAAAAQPARIERTRDETRGQQVSSTSVTQSDQAIAYATAIFAEVMHMDADQLAIDRTYEHFGVDSLLNVALVERFERDLGELPKTLLFEHNTLEKLGQHLAAAYPARFDDAPAVEASVVAAGAVAAPAAAGGDAGDQDIAIVGMAGRFPQSPSLDAFWDNLRAGRSCISEIPADRWPASLYYDADQTQAQRIYTRWGGFIEDQDKFDALFFNIAPFDAENMDPQARLFLETSWTALEDAGYTRERIGPDVGVFVGVLSNDYQLYGSEELQKGNMQMPVAGYWTIANRVSYSMDFHGPSIPVDTACSSSLTAIHLACESLRRGECEAAIAGGVSLILHPMRYLQYCTAHFLSPGPELKAFGAGADGFVDGEGVGAVVLKPLKRALADGDRIHGVIKSSWINAGGKTSGFTVPNPAAQAKVIGGALRKANIDPRSISYIEAHGTGTPLGDPIEVAGLTQAFREFTPDTGYCSIGSVKSNIGHLESAAGIAGLCKILLQLKHRQLAPTLHAGTTNGKIDFAVTPFKVQQQLESWQPAAAPGQARPVLRAGISGFGAGGSNAHVILEEAPPQPAMASSLPDGRGLFVLSAKDDERLQVYAGRLAAYLERADRSPAHFARLIRTLQSGRQALEHRLAILADDEADLLARLKQLARDGQPLPAGVWRQRILPRVQHQQAQRREREARIPDLLDARDWAELAALWVEGAAVPWERAYGAERWAPLSLPTYPFRRERHWLTTVEAPAMRAAQLHPLVDENISTLGATRYRKTLRPDDTVVQGHVIAGRRVFPATASLEFARAAAALAAPGDRAARIVDVFWYEPVYVDGATETMLRMARGDGGLDYEIVLAERPDVVLSKGRVQGGAAAAPRTGPVTPDQLDALRRRCARVLDRDGVYDRYRALGIDYGPAFRLIETLYCGAGEALAEVRMPAGTHPAGDYVLHPCLLDAVFQACLGAVGADDGTPVPVHLSSIDWYRPVPARVTAHVKLRDSAAGGAVFDLTMWDENGAPVADVAGFEFQAIQRREVQRPAPVPPGAVPPVDRDVSARALQQLRSMIAARIRLAEHKIDAQEPLEIYGIDSRAMMDLTHQLEKQFGDLPKTLFFEYPTLEQLAAYFAAHHAAQLQPAAPAVEARASKAAAASAAAASAAATTTAPAAQADAEVPIAIIGLAGHYPQARTVAQFWDVLREGRDCVTEVPAERWDHASIYSADRSDRSHVYSKWGSFLDDYDKFDPLFFNISPRDAALISPQERLFLQTAWHAFEDAGYSRRALQPIARHVGVYVGVMWGDYALNGWDEVVKGNIVAPSAQYSSIANRVSYTFNLRGPSMAVDTACSSSLTAIHLACESLRRGECAMAVAGGVNLTLHPNKYWVLSQAQFASTDGRCRSFGAGGDGYVPGEGVGAVILKPLPAAVADGDHVYGVILSTAVNHGGRSNGYSVPNPASQAEVVADALRRAAVDPRTITYLEAHGTGTSLGDPIEIAGASQAFAQFTGEKGFCAIGSVKSNIGHLESAAGMAALTKVLLQMRHRTLVPSLHSDQPNPVIDFAATPFYLQHACTDWRPDMPAASGGPVPLPLRAGISSFGAGGSNAHLIVEAYEPAAPAAASGAEGEQLLVLSARTPERLRAHAAQILSFLEKGLDDGGLPSRRDIALTLQTGRDAQPERLACLADSHDGWIAGLRAYLAGSAADGLWAGGEDGAPEAGAEADADNERAVADRDWRAIAAAWVRGGTVDWDAVHRHAPWSKVALPLYPFARERHWFDIKEAAASGTPALHPLVDGNASGHGGIRFHKRFSEREWYVGEHRTLAGAVVPASVLLEMARAADVCAGTPDALPVSIRNIAWPASLRVDGAALAVASLARKGDATEFVIAADGAEEGRLVCTGVLGTATAAPQPLDLDAIRRRCHDQVDVDELYGRLAGLGINYGGGLRVMRSIAVGAGEALVHVESRDDLSGAQWVIHPALLDGALQAAVPVVAPRAAPGGTALYLPSGLGVLTVYRPLGGALHVHVRLRPAGADEAGAERQVYTFDIDLCDAAGMPVASLRDYTVRRTAAPHRAPDRGSQESQESRRIAAFVPEWAPSPLRPAAAAAPASLLVFLDEDTPADARRALAGLAAEGARIHWVTPGASADLGAAPALRIRPGNGDDIDALMRHVAGSGGQPERILFLWDYAAPDGIADWQANLLTMFLLCKHLVRTGVPRPIDLVHAYHAGPDACSPLQDALAGLGRTLGFECPSIRFKQVRLDAPSLSVDVAARLRREAGAPGGDIAWRGGLRFERIFAKWPLPAAATPPLRANGCYLVTGGLGGIGMIVAGHLASAWQARLVLTGRSTPDERQLAQLDGLRQAGAQVEYVQADVARHADMLAVRDTIARNGWELNGIVHSAGTTADALVANKTSEAVVRVLAPKVLGVQVLDDVFADARLDFFALFSSLASVFGNPGQADYATGNRYLDSYAQWRNARVDRQERFGRTVSINWGEWRDGGMRVPESRRRKLLAETGLDTISNETGVQAFHAALSGGQAQVVMLYGEADRIEALFARAFALVEPVAVAAPEHRHAPAPGAPEPLRKAALGHLEQVVAKVLRLPPHELKPKVTFERYGVDSVAMMQMTEELEKVFGPLPKTLFFEHHSLEQLAGYFVAHHAATLAPAAMPDAAPPAAVETPAGAQSAPAQDAPEPCGDIAIIGVAGAYPQARDLDEFLRNLQEGRDCIGEIPAERWDHRAYFDDARGVPGKCYSKWGGFLDGHASFDPQLFNIAPRQARFISPQERLFLQTTWSAIENAGYDWRRLNRQTDHAVGVFVGSMWAGYDLVAQDSTRSGAPASVDASYWSIANRVSYFFDFRGPSMAVDTACSSSLAAIHLACEALRRGEIGTAIAGGVNLSLHPSKYVTLSQTEFASSDGRCRSFGDGGDGYVPGEGVGALVLKPLRQAIADGDHIHCVIKGSGMNHGGRTNGYTVPDPAAQARLIESVMRRSGIDPATIGYVEAHGTGTALGDPVEIAGLAKVFPQRGGRPYCAVGSVKSNIGHLEGAAGVAAVSKVILQFKAGQIFPSLHADRLNRNIDFAATPFHVARELMPWPRTAGQPRRAAVSSFGAGGTNVHMILEAFDDTRAAPASTGPVAIVLSARTPEQLREYAARLRDAVRTACPPLAALAFTLQTGRDPMRHRLGIQADSAGALLDTLGAFVDGKANVPGVYLGQSDPARAGEDVDADDLVYFKRLFGQGQLGKLLNLWVQGTPLDWAALYDAIPGRVEAPTYPFEQGRYWLDKPAATVPRTETNTETDPEKDDQAAPAGNIAAPDPLDTLLSQLGAQAISVDDALEALSGIVGSHTV